jgi:hypothetical protein
MTLFSSQVTNTYNNSALFSKKPYNLAGFEPGSTVSEMDVLTTAPRRHDGASLKLVEESFA